MFIFFYMKVDVKVPCKKKKSFFVLSPFSQNFPQITYHTWCARYIEMKNNSVISLKVQIQLYKNYFCNQYTDLPGE